jgi:cysteine desulfurase
MEGPFDLDHNATTPVDPRVLERFLEVESSCPHNAGSPHAGGRRARAVLEDARASAAQAAGVEPDDVVFVSSCSEANNIAVAGLGAPGLPVLLAPVEHKSIAEPASRRGTVGWEVDATGAAVVVQPNAPIGLVCLTHAQGEIGTIQPIAQAAACAREAGVALHVDAAQTVGRVPLDEVLRVAESVSVSSHKFGGLRGASLWIVRGVAPRPLLVGGGQEAGLRPGTVSPSLAAASALAFELALAEVEARARGMGEARRAFEAELFSAVRCTRVTPGEALPNTLTVRFDGVDGRALLPALDLAGVRASQGSACSSGSPEPPAVLRAMGYTPDEARQCVRFATSPRTSSEIARMAARTVAAVMDRLRSTAGGGKSAPATP